MMADRPTINRVVIAGGGTAGWLAAAALSAQLGPLLDITLIESDQIGTIGVGEATIPTMRSFHTLLGLDEREFMMATQATFKLGIAFENWGQVGDRYIHSFGTLGKSTWMGDFQHLWLRAHEADMAGPLSDYCYELQAAEAGKFYTDDTGKGGLNYAYHLDSTLYATLLRRRSEQAGVIRIEGKIAHVERSGTDSLITALNLESGMRIEGDLFIDCTGFRGLLIDQALGIGFEDWSHWLPTDSAQAVQTISTEPPVPYTRAIAHDAGWRWQIPLQHRTGNGLVYCSDHLTDDAAKERLLSSVTGDPITEPRLIRYRTGRRDQAWSGNCIAIGLSSGFVEPLESTSIHLIMTAITRLIQAFPFSGFSPAQIARYNRQARAESEDVRDFIILHYCVNARDDSAFWKRMRDQAIPDTLAARIALFTESAMAYQNGDELFRVDSWLQVMLGQGLTAERFHPVGGLIPIDQLASSLAQLKANIAQAVSKLPTHEAFIQRYCQAK